jgi:hypothetical protein
VIGYLHLVKDLDYPERYDVFVIATSLKDALDNAELYVAHEGDIVHSVMCQSAPPMSNLRFTSAVRSKLAPQTPRATSNPEAK